MRPLSIRNRILLAALLPTILLALLLSVIFHLNRVSELKEAYHQRAEALARQVVSGSEYGLFSGNRDALQALLEQLRRESDVRSASIISPEGKPLAQVGNSGYEQRPAYDGNSREIPLPAANSFVLVRPIMGSQLIFTDEFFGDPIPTPRPRQIGQLILELSLDKLSLREREFLITGILMTLGGIVFGSLLAAYLSRGVIRPITQIASVVYRIAHGDLSARVPTRANSSLQQLEEGLNRMAERIESGHEDMQRQIAAATADLRLKKEEAEIASRAKSTFLANMSHEIRTPLSAIIGLGELLRGTLSTPGQKRKMDQLCASSEHLLAIINDILDLSKMEAERLVLDHSVFQLDSVIDRVVRLLEEKARAKELLFTADAAPALRQLWLNGDPLRLSQVLINLCGNAIKFTEQGSVRLTVRSHEENDDHIVLRFSVADTGCGIAPAAQAQLFQPFVQVDASKTRAHDGTGLGLAISQRLVSLMGGQIEIDSREGVGSTFSFHAVLTRAPRSDQPDLPVAAPPLSGFKGQRILLVEDNAINQEIFLEMLENLGCTADIASDGVEAIDCARAQAYDLILMDVHMPRLDGLRATQAIRALPRYATTPIVALTASALAEDRQLCLDAGMNDHLGKPVTPAMLAALLAQWLPGMTATSTPAPPRYDHPLCHALTALPGLEIGSIWLGSMEQILAYCSLLGRFIESNRLDVAWLSRHVAAGEQESALVLAHSLKGVAGFVGARQLAALAADIETGLKNSDDPNTLCELANRCQLELMRLSQAFQALPLPDSLLANPTASQSAAPVGSAA